MPQKITTDLWSNIKGNTWNKIWTQLLNFFQFCFYLNKMLNTKKAASLNILGVRGPPEGSHDPSLTPNTVFENS
jgi:hypothetical protein